MLQPLSCPLKVHSGGCHMVKACRKPYTWPIGLQHQLGPSENRFLCRRTSFHNYWNKSRKKYLYLCGDLMQPVKPPQSHLQSITGDRSGVLQTVLWIFLWHSFFFLTADTLWKIARQLKAWCEYASKKMQFSGFLFWQSTL